MHGMNNMERSHQVYIKRLLLYTTRYKNNKQCLGPFSPFYFDFQRSVNRNKYTVIVYAIMASMEWKYSATYSYKKGNVT